MHKFTASAFHARDHAAVVERIRYRQSWRYGELRGVPAPPAGIFAGIMLAATPKTKDRAEWNRLLKADQLTYVFYSYSLPVAALTKTDGLVVFVKKGQAPSSTSARHLLQITRVLLAADKVGAL